MTPDSTLAVTKTCPKDGVHLCTLRCGITSRPVALQQLADAQLVQGKTLGIDATTLEANAARRSIVRRDTGESYAAFLTQLAEASGIATPTRARFDRTRKKKGSNDDWTHPQDPDAKLTKLKDGRTHLAHKAEHAVDLETGAIVSVTVQDADDGDTTTMGETLSTAAAQVETVLPAAAGVTEIVADTGYHSNQTQSRVAHAATDGRRHAAQPPRPRDGILRRPDRPLERVLGPRPALVVARSAGGSADRLDHTTTSARADRSRKCCFHHGLLGGTKRDGCGTNPGVCWGFSWRRRPTGAQDFWLAFSPLRRCSREGVDGF